MSCLWRKIKKNSHRKNGKFNNLSYLMQLLIYFIMWIFCGFLLFFAFKWNFIELCEFCQLLIIINNLQSDDELQSPCSNEYPNFMYGRASTLDTPVPTVKPFQNFDFQEDVRIIYTALREGDKEAVINIICRRSLYQRLVSMKENYKLIFKIFLSFNIRCPFLCSCEYWFVFHIIRIHFILELIG